jgi:hypothetical protein
LLLLFFFLMALCSCLFCAYVLFIFFLFGYALLRSSIFLISYYMPILVQFSMFLL